MQENISEEKYFFHYQKRKITKLDRSPTTHLSLQKEKSKTPTNLRRRSSFHWRIGRPTLDRFLWQTPPSTSGMIQLELSNEDDWSITLLSQPHQQLDPLVWKQRGSHPIDDRTFLVEELEQSFRFSSTVKYDLDRAAETEMRDIQ